MAAAPSQNLSPNAVELCNRIRSNPQRYSAALRQRTYHLLFDAYANTGSIAASAKAAGVSMSTATKYINEGVGGYPAIKERIRLVNMRAIEEQEQQLLHQRRVANEAVALMLEKKVDALNSVMLQPKGVYLVDENGEKIKAPNGTDLMVVDEVTFKTMSSTLRELVDTTHEMHKHSQPKEPPAPPPQPVQQNVMIGVPNVQDRETIQISAGSVIRESIPHNGTPMSPQREAQLVTILAEEQVRRNQQPKQ